MIQMLRVVKVLLFSTRLKSIIQSSSKTSLLSHTISKGLQQIFEQLIGILFITHLMACIWHLQARFLDYPSDCWVVVKDSIDEDATRLYLMAYHWALQTITTVGFGDICGYNLIEYIICILWLIVGVAFYGNAIGSICQILRTYDEQNSAMETKMTKLKLWKYQNNVSDTLYKQVRRQLINITVQKQFSFDSVIVGALSGNLRGELQANIYKEVFQKIFYFRNKSD